MQTVNQKCRTCRAGEPKVPARYCSGTRSDADGKITAKQLSARLAMAIGADRGFDGCRRVTAGAGLWALERALVDPCGSACAPLDNRNAGRAYLDLF
jgi:hypothetical protein